MKLQCIVCQHEEPGIGKVTSTCNGRKRIRDAAFIRKDVVMEQLKVIQNNDYSVYHMTKWCNKKYTMNKTLIIITENNNTKGQTEENSLYNYRRLFNPRSQYDQKCTTKKLKCIIYDCIKHNGSKTKYRIFENDSATKFIQATVFLQNEVCQNM